ncbi:MAG: peptide ABC transporter substrate-binding protein [Ruminococcaceae bacterium]|nr:peptide ABC transporter substrate-binding protein [Oscillospiraceae bacterium]
MSKKILSLILVLCMALSSMALLVSCTTGDGGEDTTAGEEGTKVVYTDPYAGIEDYDELSAKIYDDILGDFYAAYEAAKAETNESKKWAMMAIAEAKLMESGVMMPTSSNGGNYAITRVAPNTATSTLWGNDSYRYHDVIVATEFITAADRAAMKAKWAELKGTGEYEEWVEAYLTGKGYTLKNTYSIVYNSDPKNWDVLATSRAADSEALVNTYDGLMEYDMENRLMPALAESYTVSEDGKTYTFKIRQGVKWVDSQGRVVADVKADDFVAGMQHMLDAAGGLEYLVQGIIVNATEYIKGDVTDFAQVGVKAVDDYTLVYTLEQPTTFFMTMLGYGVFAPMSRTFYESMGGQFGADYNAAAETYKYGKGPDSIAYCGPYTITSFTAGNTIVFSANESYWDAANININTLTWFFNDGEDVKKSYNDAKSGVIDGAGLNSTTVLLAKEEGLYDTYSYVSSTDATSFMSFVNVNRAMYANAADDKKVVSTLTADEQTRANAALRNEHFRRALAFAIDRGTYNAQSVGEDLKYASLINSYTPGTFVALKEDVTVEINGTAKTFTAGTYYGAIMQAQIDADGVKMKVWDPNGDDGIGSSAGFDGWYNVDNAVEEMEAAIAELATIGIEITAENPIVLEMPYYSGSELRTNMSNVYKQSLEAAFGGKVKLNLVAAETSDDWYYAGYYTDFGNEANYHLYDVSGWGPDYGDPQTYLDTFLPEYAGYMVKCIGVY